MYCSNAHLLSRACSWVYACNENQKIDLNSPHCVWNFQEIFFTYGRCAFHRILFISKSFFCLLACWKENLCLLAQPSNKYLTTCRIRSCLLIINCGMKKNRLLNDDAGQRLILFRTLAKSSLFSITWYCMPIQEVRLIICLFSTNPRYFKSYFELSFLTAQKGQKN